MSAPDKVASKVAGRTVRGRRTLPTRWRAPLWVVAMSLGAVAMVLATLGTGPLRVAIPDLLPTVLGDRPQYDFAVMELGLPRALLAALLGAALGASGALLQAMTRNPLGSPDVIGFDAGAATGGLIALTVLGLHDTSVGVFAMVAGLLVALAVFGLAGGPGDGGYRLILVGIAVTSTLYGVNSYLLTRNDPEAALTGTRWLVGSLNEASWQQCGVALVGVVVLLPLACVVGSKLRALAMGEEVAIGLGLRVLATQAVVVVIAVLLSALSVAMAGPIAFVSLAAHQIAVAVVKRPQPLTLCAAATGATLLVTSDFVAQRALGSTTLPVGLVTGLLGGAYLAWLLTREWRRS